MEYQPEITSLIIQLFTDSSSFLTPRTLIKIFKEGFIHLKFIPHKTRLEEGNIRINHCKIRQILKEVE